MIYFVGAGCGAKDLITVRGANLLRQADAVVYTGSLVPPDLLEDVKTNCEIHNSATMTLDQVMAVLIRVHRAGKQAVRLHTGDPALYGAIREQMDRLRQAQIPFEICPGVSSFSCAAAVLEAEYTLPGVSQSVIITRMAGRTEVPESESIRRFASHQATMVIFLSAGMAESLQRELLAGGYPEDAPAAVVYKASWPDQKILRCTVGSLAKSLTDSGIVNHALICVGYFLGDDYELSRLYDSSWSTAFRKGCST